MRMLASCCLWFICCMMSRDMSPPTLSKQQSTPWGAACFRLSLDQHKYIMTTCTNQNLNYVKRAMAFRDIFLNIDLSTWGSGGSLVYGAPDCRGGSLWFESSNDPDAAAGSLCKNEEICRLPLRQKTPKKYQICMALKTIIELSEDGSQNAKIYKSISGCCHHFFAEICICSYVLHVLYTCHF